MAARSEGPAERYRRKGVAGIAEGGDEEAAARLDQTRSATARIISLRPSAVQDIGVIISVPTPASR